MQRPSRMAQKPRWRREWNTSSERPQQSWQEVVDLQDFRQWQRWRQAEVDRPAEVVVDPPVAVVGRVVVDPPAETAVAGQEVVDPLVVTVGQAADPPVAAGLVVVVDPPAAAVGQVAADRLVAVVGPVEVVDPPAARVGPEVVVDPPVAMVGQVVVDLLVEPLLQARRLLQTVTHR